MSKIVKIPVIVLILFLTVQVSAKEKIRPELKTLDQIFKSVAKEIEKEFKITCIGHGGRAPDKIEQVDLDFISYKNTSIDQARIMEVKATEKLLQALNSNESIKPFLADYPFKTNRANILISFSDENDDYFPDNGLALVFQAKDKVYYETYDPLTDRLKNIKQEPYEEALKIVQAK